MSDRINEEAQAWHDALDRDDADWDGFTLWLEADPAHRDAFDEIARIEDLVARNRATLSALTADRASPAEVPPRRWRWNVAATVAAMALAPMLLLLRPEAAAPPASYATGPGGTRAVALADGTRVDLSASTRLAVAEQGRQLTLAGTASFDVPHRPGRVMIVHAGGVDIQDIGTRFEVSTAPGLVRIAVADGRLVARLSDGHAITVSGGQRLIVDSERGSAQIARFSPHDWAAWQRGRLVYDDVPLVLVAADVSRFTGTEIRMNPNLSRRRFSGILRTRNGSELVRTLAQVMDLDARPEGKAVRLLPRGADGGRGPAS